jgi:PAS domain-containing protein
MLGDPPTVHAGLLLAFAAASALLGAAVARKRRVPGRAPFVAFTLAVVVWTVPYAAGLLTRADGVRVALEAVAWVGRASIAVPFLLFALAYTGRDEHVTPRTVAALAAPPAAAVVLVWTSAWHDLFWATDPRAIVVDGLSLVVAAQGPAFWAVTAYAYALLAVGAVLVLRLVVVSEALYADQSLLLGVGVAAPFVGNLATVLPPHPIPGFDYTPYAFAVTAVAFGYALFRSRLFDSVPATRALGRATAVGAVDAGILVVDGDERVVYANPAAADLADADPAALLGRDVRSLVDVAALDYGVEDAVAEFERDGRVHEVRSSPVTDRHDRTIGHALIVYDVTARRRRERRLATQRDELERLEELNAAIRGVHRALVSATDRAGIERAVAERLAEGSLYRTACVADLATWTGDADRWVVAGEDADPRPPSVDPERLDREGRSRARAAADDAADPDRGAGAGAGAVPEGSVRRSPRAPTAAADGGTWCVVPLVSGRTVYGALGLFTDRDGVDDREHDVLGELGRIVGRAIDGAETRQLLSAGTVVELELVRDDGGDPLVAAAGETGRAELAGLVPARDGGAVAYVRVEGDDATAAAERLAAAAGDDVRPVRGDDPDSPLEWRVAADGLLGVLVDGGNVRTAETDAGDGTVRYVVELSSGDAARALIDGLSDRVPSVRVAAKRERSGPVEEGTDLSGDALAGMTDRQRESLEAAYRAGYFETPRDSTAEEVADSLDIASPTLHAHLRKAQDSLLSDLFDAGEGNG